MLLRINKNYIKLTMITYFKETDLGKCYQSLADILIEKNFVKSVSVRSLQHLMNSKHINFRLLASIVKVLDLDVEKILIRKESIYD